MPYISSVVAKMMLKHGTNNPFEIAAQKNIMVLFSDLGETFGFFFSERRVKFIHINSALDDSLKRFVCAHELGHCILHPKLNTSFMQKNTFFSVDRIEKEANIFAVKLLVHNISILEGETKYQFCMRVGLPIEMAGYL